MDNKHNIQEVMQAVDELLEILKTENIKSISLQFDILKSLAQEKNLNIFAEILNENRSLLFPVHGGLTDFYVWTGEENRDKNKNRKISELANVIWKYSA